MLKAVGRIAYASQRQAEFFLGKRGKMGKREINLVL